MRDFETNLVFNGISGIFIDPDYSKHASGECKRNYTCVYCKYEEKKRKEEEQKVKNKLKARKYKKNNRKGSR